MAVRQLGFLRVNALSSPMSHCVTLLAPDTKLELFDMDLVLSFALPCCWRWENLRFNLWFLRASLASLYDARAFYISLSPRKSHPNLHRHYY